MSAVPKKRMKTTGSRPTTPKSSSEMLAEVIQMAVRKEVRAAIQSMMEPLVEEIALELRNIKEEVSLLSEDRTPRRKKSSLSLYEAMGSGGIDDELQPRRQKPTPRRQPRKIFSQQSDLNEILNQTAESMMYDDDIEVDNYGHQRSELEIMAPEGIPPEAIPDEIAGLLTRDYRGLLREIEEKKKRNRP